MNLSSLVSPVEFPEVTGSALKGIVTVLVDAVFTAVATVVTRDSLEGESFRDIRRRLDVGTSFGSRPMAVGIDKRLLETNTKNPWRSLTNYFHEEYSGRLNRALKAEEWRMVRAERVHIKILSKLTGSKTTLFTLDGGPCDASPPLLILLELRVEYLEMSQVVTALTGELTVAIIEIIRLFRIGSSTDLLERELPAGLQTLVLSASGLGFCVELVRLISGESRLDHVEERSPEAVMGLKESYDLVVKRIENMRNSSAQTPLRSLTTREATAIHYPAQSRSKCSG
jgi:hypothetical protein